MPTRRTLVFTALTALLSCSDLSIAYAAPPPVSDPVGIVSEIYTRVTKGRAIKVAALSLIPRRQKQNVSRSR